MVASHPRPAGFADLGMGNMWHGFAGAKKREPVKAPFLMLA